MISSGTNRFDEGNMSKVKLGKKLPPMAMPVVLVGANVKGKANFCTLAWVTMMEDEPPLIGLMMGKKRRTKDGMLENGTFSVNIPSASMVRATDYCGIRTGARTDKSQVFDIFYGELGTAPMISEAPITAECRLKEIVLFHGTDLIIGEVNEVYADKKVMSKGKVDLGKVDPLLYALGGGPYFSLGPKVAKAFSVGKGYKRK
jgi:flavin reductase (DIM6/NTAB) family NADH-FMN oxidoreductase RutF